MILQWFRGCFIAKCVLIGSSNYFAAGPKRSAISFDEAMILELVFMASMTADAFPKARKRMEEFVETFNRTSNQTIDLFEKTLGVYQATSVTDAQRRVQDLIESSLTTLRVNVHSALNTNAKIIADWKELVDRFGPAVKK